jgi:uncharacterized lipoprotein
MHRRTGATEAKWRRIYQAFQESGLACKDFCRERGVNYYTFRDWSRRFAKDAPRRSAFVEIGLPVATQEYTIVLKGGRELRVAGGFSAARVRQLIELCETC